MERGKSAHLHALVRYDLDPDTSSESAEEMLRSLRAALPLIRNKAVLRTFDARISPAGSPVGDEKRTRANSFGAVGPKIVSKAIVVRRCDPLG